MANTKSFFKGINVVKAIALDKGDSSALTYKIWKNHQEGVGTKQWESAGQKYAKTS